MAELESCIAHMVEEIASLKKIASELRLPSVLAMPIQRSVNIPVTIDQGGTGGTTASAARTALGIGTDDNTVNIGDPNTNGSWRFTISGANLLVQKREAGSWVEKGQFQP